MSRVHQRQTNLVTLGVVRLQLRPELLQDRIDAIRAHHITQTGEESENQLELCKSATFPISVQLGAEVVDSSFPNSLVRDIGDPDDCSDEGDLERLLDDTLDSNIESVACVFRHSVFSKLTGHATRPDNRPGTLRRQSS